MESYGANEARLKMRDILTAVERGEHIELKRYDTPSGVIVPVDWYRRAVVLTDIIGPTMYDMDAAVAWPEIAAEIREAMENLGKESKR